MIINIHNTIINKSTPIEIEDDWLDEFTTYDLYETVFEILNVTISNIQIFYDNKKVEESEYILCKDIFKSLDINKIYIYPSLKTNTLFSRDFKDYNYLEYIHQEGQINDLWLWKSKNEAALNRLKCKKILEEKRDRNKFHEFEKSLNNNNNTLENEITKNKMNSILSNIREKQKQK